MTLRKKLAFGTLAFALLASVAGVYPVSADEEFGYSGALWVGEPMKVKNIKPLTATFQAPEFFGTHAPDALNVLCECFVVKGSNLDKGIKGAKGKWIAVAYPLSDSTGVTMRVLDSGKFKTGADGKATIEREIPRPWGFNILNCLDGGMPGNCALPYFEAKVELTNSKKATGVEWGCQWRIPLVAF